MSGSSPVASALYEGWVRHRRWTPRPHAFRYPLFMALPALDEIPEVFASSRLWSDRGPALLRFEAIPETPGPAAFDATLVLRRRPVTSAALVRLASRHLGMTLRVVAWIHWQALRLWLRRFPFHPHPDPHARRFLP